MCYRTGKYTVCRCVRASFSPEILQAAAVKWLITWNQLYAETEEQPNYANFEKQ